MRLSTGVETGHFTQNRCSGHDRFSIYMIGLHIIRRSSKIWAPLGGSDAHDFRYCGVIALPALVVIGVTIVDVVKVRRSR